MGPPARQQTAAIEAAFIHCPEIEQHAYPPGCPFDSSRAGQVRRAVDSMGLLDGAGHHEVAPVAASRADLLEFHDAVYLDVLEAATRGHLDVQGLEMGIGREDTPVFAGLFDYASLACGASLKAAELIIDGQAGVAFNPSGGYHHAGPAAAAGFCYLNDVVLACMRLTAAGKRVMFIDVDAHHGDGVQDAFYDRSDVLTVSFHQDGRTLYPGTGFEHEIGVGEGEGYAVNVPLPPGIYDEPFIIAFQAVALPMLAIYEPDVIVLELGMDGLAGDPLTAMSLTNNAYAEVIEAVMASGRPVLAVGGGGYNVPNTVRAWTLAWSILCGADSAHDDMSLGLGGVMLATTDWASGLRDRVLAPDEKQRATVPEAVRKTIEAVQRHVFAFHGLW